MEFKSYDNTTFSNTEYYKRIPVSEQKSFDILADIFHFKINNYVAEHLIDWDRVPEDPIYRMVFPQKEMLPADDFEVLSKVWEQDIPADLKQKFIFQLRKNMAPRTITIDHSVPKLDGKPIQGMYNTFTSDLSLFPAPMSLTCHSYCNYCFRWIMFNDRDLQNSTTYDDPELPVSWLRSNPQVSDVLFTGADPMIVGARKIRRFVEPILQVDSVKTINISTKSLAWWPFRFTKANDADELLRLFDDIVASGKLINIPAHFTHPRELEHPEVAKAVMRIHNTGATIRTQGPLIKNVNDRPEDWTRLWDLQVKMGMVPYYMFIEADSNSNGCFRNPISESLEIFKTALANSSTLARSVRGPVFMYDLNRVLLDGTTTVMNQDYFVLKTLQAPPGSRSEGEIRLVPFSSEALDLGSLYQLFHSSTLSS